MSERGNGEAGDDDRVAERAYYRRFRDKGNKRDDWAVDTFREVFAHLESDPARVDRLLFDLGRYYNALTDAPIVDLATRRRVVECLARGAVDEARRPVSSAIGAASTTGSATSVPPTADPAAKPREILRNKP
jgi:hypothetical protein